MAGSLSTSGCGCLLVLAAAMAAILCEDMSWKYWLRSALYCAWEEGLKKRLAAVAGLWSPERDEVVGKKL